MNVSADIVFKRESKEKRTVPGLFLVSVLEGSTIPPGIALYGIRYSNAAEREQIHENLFLNTLNLP